MLCTDEIEPSGPDLVAPAPPGALGPASPTTRELDNAYKNQELAALKTAHQTLRAEHEELVALGNALREQRSLASLRSLRDAWAQHSQHEEALFEQVHYKLMKAIG